MTEANIFSRPLATIGIETRHRSCAIAANAEERLALAQVLGLLALDEFSADLTARRPREHLIEISGNWRARLTQACVVSLVPVPDLIEAELRLQFLEGPAPDTAEADELDVDFVEADPPEPVTGGAIDLGAVLVEQLILALNPYPRTADATLPREYLDQEPRPAAQDADVSEPAAKSNPFKILLKNYRETR